MKKLAIISTHPIQYYAPIFKLIAEGKIIMIKVFYTRGEVAETALFDRGFGQPIKWDIPLLEGYEHEFISNTSSRPGSHHFKGIINPDLIEKISAWGADALLVFGWNFSGHLKVLKYFKGKIPILFRGDSTLLNERRGFSVKKIARLYILREVYRLIDFALYVGENNKAYYTAHGVDESKLIFVPHAVDNERFAVCKKNEAGQLRKQMGITEDGILMMFAGKFQRVKNPLLLLKAFISAKMQNVHLLFVGNGVLETKLKKKAAGIKNIHFANFQNQQTMPVYYQACDIFCLPSKSETWGLAVNEAMACKKAVLISDRVGCSKDLVKYGMNGYIFQHNSLNDFISKLKLITADKKIVSEMGETSGKIIRDWSFNEIAKKIETCVIDHC